MDSPQDFEIFLTAPPGLEAALGAELRARKFRNPKVTVGGVLTSGGWPEVWRANLEVRGAGHVLARIGAFRVFHLAQLDKRARKFPWSRVLRADVPVRVEVTCSKSKIYHAGAAAQRIEAALREELGVKIADEAAVCIKARIEDDLCTISIDTSGESLHKRGHKVAVGRAPMRETMAALFLYQCGYDGREPVVDPMCGSGTFVIEAAEIAAGLNPGRSRSFAFELLKSFESEAWQHLRQRQRGKRPVLRFFGSDRDAGAIAASVANARRAGVAEFTEFRQQPVSAITPPAGPSGLVIVNPPYGTRIGDRKPLLALHAALGQTLLKGFSGWRVGLITSEPALAKATALPFAPPGRTVLHGGLRVQLFQTGPLA
ncbi:MAG: class I SAM-dependent RNA methyltransferase [Alphaproteobacteria bacterium]|nr:class I SAM-dependent RNA methyltransferase [Alphaproteobacteria bacterium]